MLNRKPVVALDCDGVLCVEPYAEILELYNTAQLAKDRLALSDMRRYDFKPAQKELHMVYARPDLYDHLEPTAEAMRMLRDLSSEYRVIAVSHAYDEHAGSKMRYLARHGFNRKNIVLTKDKDIVGFDVIVEDNPNTLVRVGPIRGICYEQPWNELFRVENRGFITADRLRDIPSAVEAVLSR